MYRLELSRLNELLNKIKEDREVYIPIERNGKVNYWPYKEDEKVSVETLKTVKSPKDAFFPQSENLYTCVKEDKKIKIIPQELINQEFVVFGMKGCDLQGVEVLDKVFLSDPIDTFYASRREHGIIVTLACNEPEESCFCTAFAVDPSCPKGDITTWIINEYLYFEPNSEKGEKLIASLESILENERDTKAVENKKEEIRSILKMLPYGDLSLKGWNGEALKEKFDSPVWEDLYKPCLACGTCTFVCPTCQCYDIKDYDTGHGVQRYRCWDSCMYSDFTMMAHGNNRNSQMQRFRQRFLHKLVYFPANNNGMYSCTGCGRCVEKCPSALNIVKVIKAFEKAGGDK